MKCAFADDLHVHLRDGIMVKSVAKRIRSGGCNRVLVMPNTQPPISTCLQALDYYKTLKGIEPDVKYLMTLFLSDSVLASDLVENARTCHVQGIKCYPEGVTTNSACGVTSLEPYYPIFDVMSKLNLSLHIHCEAPKVDPLDAEEAYLFNVEAICKRFPQLKVVLEHASTKAALQLVFTYPNLAATITPQHLMYTVEDVVHCADHITNENLTQQVAKPHLFCKPLYKHATDRQALQEAIISRHPRLFLGSDSAPHPKDFKESQNPPAGVYSQPQLLSYYATVFQQLGCLDYLEAFASVNGATFLQLPPKEIEFVQLVEKKIVIMQKVPDEYDGIVPLLGGHVLNFEISTL